MKIGKLEVTDAHEPFAVPRIQKRDVDRSVPRDVELCIAALAAKRDARVVVKDQYGGGVRVGASRVFVRFKDNPEVWVRYFLPERDIARVRIFDENHGAVRKAGDWIAGQTIQFNPPPRSRVLGRNKPEYAGGKNKKGKAAPDPLTREPCLRHALQNVVPEQP